MPSQPTDTALRLSQAARFLGVDTREVARLVHGRAICHVMIDGIAHVPADAADDYLVAHAADR